MATKSKRYTTATCQDCRNVVVLHAADLRNGVKPVCSNCGSTFFEVAAMPNISSSKGDLMGFTPAETMPIDDQLVKSCIPAAKKLCAAMCRMGINLSPADALSEVINFRQTLYRSAG